MRPFRYLFSTIAILIISASLSIFKKEIGLDFITDNSIIETTVWIALLISAVSLFSAIKKFNKHHFTSYLLTFLSLSLFVLFGYAATVSILKHTYELRVTHDYNLDNYKIRKIPDQTELKILSYTNAYDCTTKKTFYYSVVCIIKENQDTIRVLTPCQLLSKTAENATFNIHSNKIENILDSLNLNFHANNEKYILIDKEIPFQDGNYEVVVGTISYDEEVNVFEE